MNQRKLLTEKFADDLIFDEGKQRRPYDDANGQPIVVGSKVKGNITIGVGRALNRNPLTEEEINFLLQNDVNRVLNWCYSNLAWFESLSINRKRAIANMVFQIGGIGFLKFRKFIEACIAGDFTAAYHHGKNSLWAEQTPARAEKILLRMRDDK